MAIKFLKVILAIALVGGLFLAGQTVYRRLPPDAASVTRAEREQSGIELTVVMRDGMTKTLSNSVEAYAVDFAALQREYFNGPRQQRQFDEFLSRRLKGLEPARGQLDGKGRVVLHVTPGNWWVRAVAELASGESLEWRLPVNIAVTGQVVELTPENVYEKTKKF
jgi:hypothetical protein